MEESCRWKRCCLCRDINSWRIRECCIFLVCTIHSRWKLEVSISNDWKQVRKTLLRGPVLIGFPCYLESCKPSHSGWQTAYSRQGHKSCWTKMGQSDKGSMKRCPSMRVKGRNGSIGFIRICSCGEQGERKLFRDFFLMLPLLLFLLWMNHCMHVAENPDASSDHYLQSTNLLLSFPIDVVGAALKPACVSKISIQRLNLDLRPRYIHVITSPPFRSGSNKISVTMTTKCDAFQRMENNLRCYEETQIVPSDVTLVATDEYLERKFGTKAYQSVRNKNIQTSGA